MIQRAIFVTHRFPAFHRWADAPDEVGFLRDLHRHLFHVRVDIEVFHDDRELEFFLVQKVVIEHCDQYEAEGVVGSCEMVADEILNLLKDNYGDHRMMTVEVSEDGENGAAVHA